MRLKIKCPNPTVLSEAEKVVAARLKIKNEKRLFLGVEGPLSEHTLQTLEAAGCEISIDHQYEMDL